MSTFLNLSLFQPTSIGFTFWALFANFALFCAYWYWSIRYLTNSVPKLNAQLRQLWIKTFSESKDSELLAVHVFRNALMVCNILASSTVLLALALFTLLAHTADIHRILHNFEFFSDTQKISLELKIICSIIWQVITFFCFMTAIRYYGHVSFLVSLHFKSEVHHLDLLNIYLNRAAKSYSIGQRLMLFSIPLFSWMLGDITFIIMNLLTIALMYMTDRF